MLYDKNFLLELDKTKNKIIYAKVTALTFNELPISNIEGRVTAGSVNLDGDSAVRRTCSLTLVANNFNYSDYSWGLNTKFKLEIGVQNDINPSFPEIIWFNQGIYLITSFNVSRSTVNFTINIQGKDKMSLLNGEIGGSIGVQTDFGTIEEEDSEGTWTIRHLPISEIIKHLVHTYAGEPYHNIVIKDLSNFGLELLEYRYENVDLIFYRKKDSNTYINYLLTDNNTNKDKFRRMGSGFSGAGEDVLISQLKDTDFETLTESLTDEVDTSTPYFARLNSSNNLIYKPGTTELDPDELYKFTRLTYGDTAGYRLTDPIYPGELIANVGESVTSVLDKIKSVLAHYEYFYDLDGRFVFQKKQSILSTPWQANEDKEEEVQEALALSSTSVYDFHGGDLITAFNSNPSLLNLRNDFSIWGERQGVSGAKIPIHLRYAIDIKPSIYTTITLSEKDIEEVKDYNEKYKTTLDEDQTSTIYSTEFILMKCSKCGHLRGGSISKKCPHCGKNKMEFINYKYVADWREVLYMMAKDYYRYNILNDFEIRVGEANPQHYPFGKTGYEQYYTDIEVCWRYLYNNELKSKIKEYTTSQKTYKKQVKEQEKEVAKQEKDMSLLNNDLNKETFKKEPDQSKIDNCQVAIMNASEALSKERADLEQKKYLLTQVEEKLENATEQIENYFQINEIPQIVADTVYFNLKSSVSIFKSSKVTISLISGGKEQNKEDYRFTIDGSNDIVKLNSEKDNSKALRLIWSEKDGIYLKILSKDNDTYICQYFNTPWLNWNKDVYTHPNALNYWFDFLDIKGDLGKYNTKMIGSRTKSINDTSLKSIYFRETPPVIYGLPDGEDIPGYKYIGINEDILENMFTISAQGKSAKDRLDELLYDHSYFTESVTITTIPIYYLQPNVRVHIFDPETKIDGDYIVSKISIPLTYNGTMQITATKAADTLFF